MLRIVEQRIITRYGILKLSEKQRKAFSAKLTAEVVRDPDNMYKNLKYPEPRCFFGYLQGFEGERLVFSEELAYPNSLSWDYLNVQDFVSVRIRKEALKLGAWLLEAFSPSFLTPNPSPYDEPPIQSGLLPFDKFRLTCYSNCSVRLSFWSDEHLVADGLRTEWVDARSLGEDTINTPVVVTPDGTEIIPSVPYDGETDSGESYYPQNVGVIIWVYRAVRSQVGEVYICSKQNGQPGYSVTDRCRQLFPPGEGRTYGFPEEVFNITYKGKDAYSVWCLLSGESILSISFDGFAYI